MPPTFQPMLASPARGRDLTGGGWVCEPKLDGWRALVYVADGRLTVRSRTGRDVTASVPELAGLAGALGGRDVVLDGELVAGDGRAWDFYRLGPRMASRQAGRAPVTFAAFDVLWVDGVSVCRLPYVERRTLLDGLRLAGPRWHPVEVFDADPADLLTACADLGLEGVVAKRAASRYRPGRRSPDWVKLKTVEWRAVHAERRLPEQRRPVRQASA